MKQQATSYQLPVTKLGAKQLRVSKPSHRDISRIKRREIYIVCDNVLDTYNIGSIFRLADAVVAKCVYLCGGSETPPNSRIAKASVGCDKWVPWQYASTAGEAIKELRGKFSPSTDGSNNNDKGRGLKIIAIEQSPKSIDFRKASYRLPVTSDQALVFVVGHETEGVSKEVLDLADQIVEIPMFGVNISLNVMVSLAIVLYRAI